MSKNPVTLWEMASRDAGATVEFFSKVFDWGLTKDAQFSSSISVIATCNRFDLNP